MKNFFPAGLCDFIKTLFMKNWKNLKTHLKTLKINVSVNSTFVTALDFTKKKKTKVL